MPPNSMQQPRIPPISATTTTTTPPKTAPSPETPFSDKEPSWAPWESQGRARQRQRASERARAQQGSLPPLRPPAVLLRGEAGGGDAASLHPPPHRARTGGSGPTHAVFFLLRWDPHAAPPAGGAAPEAGSPLPEWSSGAAMLIDEQRRLFLTSPGPLLRTAPRAPRLWRRRRLLRLRRPASEREGNRGRRSGQPFPGGTRRIPPRW